MHRVGCDVYVPTRDGVASKGFGTLGFRALGAPTACTWDGAPQDDEAGASHEHEQHEGFSGQCFRIYSFGSTTARTWDGAAHDGEPGANDGCEQHEGAHRLREHHGLADTGQKTEQRGEAEDSRQADQVEGEVLRGSLVVSHKEVHDEGVERRLDEGPWDLRDAAADTRTGFRV